MGVEKEKQNRPRTNEMKTNDFVCIVIVHIYVNSSF